MRIYHEREKASPSERKTVLRMHRATDVLSTLHNTALVVNSMTFEQNAAVSPYDRASQALQGREKGRFLFIRSYCSARRTVLFRSSPFLLSRLALKHI